MGITIIQKSDLGKNRAEDAKALILAGGAIAGGSFKAGGVKALGDYLTNFKITDFDIFVGISSGSMLAAALMAGISPESMLKSLDGTSSHFSPLAAWHCYRLNVPELFIRPLKFLAQAAALLPGGFLRLVKKYPDWAGGFPSSVLRFMKNPSVAAYEEMMKPIFKASGMDDLPSLIALLPSGIFDNRPIESYIRGNIERNGLTNNFKKAFEITGKRLYISAMRLDGAKRVVFGPDENSSLKISEAIWASTALPGFYKPARIHGVDYVDGGVHETANIDIAIKKGAKLIVCYNPFRPYDAGEFVEGFARGRRNKGIATEGIIAVMNQIMRAFLHTRLHLALDGFQKNPSFLGDIILIEPRAEDRAFFALNPFFLKNRVEAAKLGFESVRNSINEKFDEVAAIFSSYGIGMSKSSVEDEFKLLARPGARKTEVQMLLEGRGNKRARRGRMHVKRIARRLKRR